MKFWHGYEVVVMLNTLVGQLKCQLITNGVRLWINKNMTKAKYVLRAWPFVGI